MKPTSVRMDVPDPTKKDGTFLVNFKIVRLNQTPVAKLECSGTYDKKTVDAILALMGLR